MYLGHERIKAMGNFKYLELIFNRKVNSKIEIVEWINERSTAEWDMVDKKTDYDNKEKSI